MSRALGETVEQQVLDYLQRQGLKLIARNFHSRQGEIDLIMRDRDSLVFVEVRYRKGSRFGSAAESVDPRKQQRLIQAAQYFLLRNPSLQALACRFDVVACSPEPGNFTRPRLSIKWISDAFRLD